MVEVEEAPGEEVVHVGIIAALPPLQGEVVEESPPQEVGPEVIPDPGAERVVGDVRIDDPEEALATPPKAPDLGLGLEGEAAPAGEISGEPGAAPEVPRKVQPADSIKPVAEGSGEDRAPQPVAAPPPPTAEQDQQVRRSPRHKAKSRPQLPSRAEMQANFDRVDAFIVGEANKGQRDISALARTESKLRTDYDDALQGMDPTRLQQIWFTGSQETGAAKSRYRHRMVIFLVHQAKGWATQRKVRQPPYTKGLGAFLENLDNIEEEELFLIENEEAMTWKELAGRKVIELQAAPTIEAWGKDYSALNTLRGYFSWMQANSTQPTSRQAGPPASSIPAPQPPEPVQGEAPPSKG
jgi:hypothetical protein